MLDRKFIRVIGHDPGSRNYAFSVVDARIHNKVLQYRILKCGIVEPVIPALKEGLHSGLLRLIGSLNSILGEFKPIDYFIAERFISRGLMGDIGERTNIMLGVSLTLTSRSKVGLIGSSLITASTWKNQIKSKVDLKRLYKQCSRTPHEIDASFIALYKICVHFGVKPFSFITSLNHIRKFMEEVEENSISKPRKIRPTEGFNQCFVH